MISPVRTTSSRSIYTNAWMTVREDTFVRPDGGEGLYGVVDKPDYALVIALDRGALMMVEQYRYPLGLRRWEFPQGTAPDRATMAPGELAARELREETGLTAASWEELGLLDVAPGVSSQRGRVYLATGVSQGETEREATESDMRASWIPRADVEAMVRAGEITDAQSIAAYALLGLAGH